jgi:hypothetical protein
MSSIHLEPVGTYFLDTPRMCCHRIQQLFTGVSQPAVSHRGAVINNPTYIFFAQSKGWLSCLRGFVIFVSSFRQMLKTGHAAYFPIFFSK